MTPQRRKEIDAKFVPKDESKEVKEGGEWCYDGNESESYTLLYNGKPMVDMSTGEDEAIELVSLLNEKEAQSKNMYYALKEIVLYHRTGNGNTPLFESTVRQAEEILLKAKP